MDVIGFHDKCELVAESAVSIKRTSGSITIAVEAASVQLIQCSGEAMHYDDVNTRVEELPECLGDHWRSFTTISLGFPVPR